MKVLFIAAEAAPFVKVGGLGDVMGALPKELMRQGMDVRVVIPYYKSIGKRRSDIVYQKHFYVDLAYRSHYCGIFETQVEGVTFYLLDNEYYFWRDRVYGEFDDAERFAFFSRAALSLMKEVDFQADIVQANDWHTSLSVIYLNRHFKPRDLFYINMKTLISIHNIEFQGKFSPDILSSVFGLGEEERTVVSYDGCINLLKGAIQLADKVTTVSETYGREILNPYFSFGLHNILLREKQKIRGIINGIDTELFDPATDPSLFENYDKSSYRQKKKKNKSTFQEAYALKKDETVPMIAMVSRLTSQKGMDLVMAVAEELVEMDIQFVLLGTGDKNYEYAMANFEWNHRDKVRSIIKFSTSIASQLYAASDLFLMPSKQEPCGLSQMIAMRYGSIPVVHRIGGLKDTVIPFNEETGEGTGVTFESYNAHDMLDAIRRAVAFYHNEKNRERIIENAMSQDLSWRKPANDYRKIYEELLNR